MAAYAEQVLICTGKDDWKSRIEEEEDGVLVRHLKTLLGRGGKLCDPYHNVMVTNSSFAPTASSGKPVASAYLLPSFRYIPSIPLELSEVEKLAKGFLLPDQPHSAHGVLPPEQLDMLKRDSRLQEEFPSVRDVDEILVLICGHGGRDERCGILGPLLRDEFEEKLNSQGIQALRDPSPSENNQNDPHPQKTARVGLISHIGGHKYAGNVIIYIPPSLSGHPLAGRGIWYGRVDPEHVEGIVQTTIIEGKVIKDMFRGGIEQGGALLRL